MKGRLLSLMLAWLISRQAAPCNACFRAAAHSARPSLVQFRRRALYRLYQTTRLAGANELALAEHAFARLARRGKSWKRLGPMVDLAVCYIGNKSLSQHTENRWRGIADVGTDHGLLAVGLAITGRFERVVGVDVSQHALRDGAFKLQEEILSFRNDTPLLSVLEFRESNGLHAVRRGEADTLCIAGMGVHSMVEILTAKRALSSSQHHQLLLLDDLDCQRLIIQPTNSRPHHLTHLYDNLNEIGWSVQDERIEFLSSRWYLSVAFERKETAMDAPPPGALLALSMDSLTMEEFGKWVIHHRKWILQDASMTGSLLDEDKRWLEAFGSMGDLATTE